MNTEERYPVLDVNLGAIRRNAHIMCRYLALHGVEVTGVIKFSDGDLNIARAYYDGGCKQIASSRSMHLRRVKECLPGAETMLIRTPMPSECAEVVTCCDVSLNSEASVLQALNDAARRNGTTHGVILMLDVGDLREGVLSEQELCALARLVENRLPGLRLKGVGTSYACFGGVLPTWESLQRLVAASRQVEDTIGRKLEIVSGGSSINLTLYMQQVGMPPGVTNLRLGGSIANPMSIRHNRGVSIPMMEEDTFALTAEIIEVDEKPSSPAGAVGLNWAGNRVEYADKGLRKRAIIALGSQDIGSAEKLIPLDAGVAVIGGSSDHTIMDITGSSRSWRPGDKVTFRLQYMPLLYSFSTRHVQVRYSDCAAAGGQEMAFLNNVC